MAAMWKINAHRLFLLDLQLRELLTYWLSASSAREYRRNTPQLARARET
jgi:hypothetical protein